MDPPRVAVIATGRELLRGRAADTHLAFFARRLEEVGLEVAGHATCGDERDEIVGELRRAASRARIVLVTGGLGPTEDDRTREAVAATFDRPLVFRPAQWRAIRARLRRYRVASSPAQRRQAFLPEGARAIPNRRGSAPGFRLSARGVYVAALPGPPGEMEPMFDRFVLPWLVRSFRLRGRLRLWEALVYGLPEARVDAIAAPIVRRHGASFGITASGGSVRLAVRIDRGPVRPLARAMGRALGIHLVGPRRLEEAVFDLLRRRRASIAVAESCTGGLVCHKLTNVPGMSDWLKEGWVTYTIPAKVTRLGVLARLIRRRGVVSAEVASAMAEGAAWVAGADVGVGVTGVAGPTGGTRRIPVGTVFHAVRYRGRTRVERRRFPGDRVQVKDRAANHALDLVRRALIEG